MARTIKNPLAMQETQVQPLGWEDPLEEGMATHSSILAWRIPCRGTWRATVHGVTEESDMTDVTEHAQYAPDTMPSILFLFPPLVLPASL